MPPRLSDPGGGDRARACRCRLPRPSRIARAARRPSAARNRQPARGARLPARGGGGPRRCPGRAAAMDRLQPSPSALWRNRHTRELHLLFPPARHGFLAAHLVHAGHCRERSRWQSWAPDHAWHRGRRGGGELLGARAAGAPLRAVPLRPWLGRPCRRTRNLPCARSDARTRPRAGAGLRGDRRNERRIPRARARDKRRPRGPPRRLDRGRARAPGRRRGSTRSPHRRRGRGPRMERGRRADNG